MSVVHLGRGGRDLDAAAHHVGYEWLTLAEMTAELDQVPGTRTLTQTALLEALLIHARCLINFVCGDRDGRHHKDDIIPADFLGYEWWPADQELDRTLRGRLPMINKHLAHVSWDRVTDGSTLIWSVVLVSHQTHWAMKLFTAEAQLAASSQAPLFQDVLTAADAVMPALGRRGETPPLLAPPRR